MFLRQLPKIQCRSGIRRFSDDFKDKWNANRVNPIQRTLDILRGDFKEMLGVKKTEKRDGSEWDSHMDKYIAQKPFQTHCDVLVIGGGGIGSSIAYWLKKEAREGLNVVVVEKDPMVS